MKNLLVEAKSVELRGIVDGGRGERSSLMLERSSLANTIWNSSLIYYSFISWLSSSADPWHYGGQIIFLFIPKGSVGAAEFKSAEVYLAVFLKSKSG